MDFRVATQSKAKVCSMLMFIEFNVNALVLFRKKKNEKKLASERNSEFFEWSFSSFSNSI